MSLHRHRRIAAAIAIAGSHACSQAGSDLHTHTGQDLTTREVVLGMTAPTTPLDIVSNVASAFRTHALLSDAIYDHETLLVIFGGKRIDWGTNTAADRHGELLGYEYIIPPHPVRGRMFQSLSAHFAKRQTPGGMTVVSAHLSMRSPNNATFSAIEKLLGTDWAPSRDIISPHETIGPPTHANGNRRIDYLLAPAPLTRVHLVFSADGSLSRADFVQER